MPGRIRVDLFCEDAAHESWCRALLGRLADEASIEVSIRGGTANLGIPRLKRELRAFSRILEARAGLPDLLVVMIDANDVGPRARRQEIEDAIDLGTFPAAVVGTPDPCVERWFLADPESFSQRFGPVPSIPAGAPGEVWKDALIQALETAGEIVTGGGAEFAGDVMEYGENEPLSRGSLGSNAQELRR